MSELSHQQIKERAYQLWQAEGNVPGNDMHYWLKAEAELQVERLSAPPVPATPPAKKAAKPKTSAAAAPKAPAKPKKATTGRARKAPQVSKADSAPTP